MPAMSEGFVDDLLSRHLPELFPGVLKKNFLFLLFGGEPLLPTNRAVISRILEYAHKHSIKVSTATNAVTLPQMVDLIGPQNGKIQNVQLTLDGDRLYHDGQRVPRSGKPTFDDMIAALRMLMRLKVHVFIRIHTHPGKLGSAERLVEYLEREGILNHPRVEVYFAPINTFNFADGSPDDFETFCRVFQKVAAKTERPPSLNLDFLHTVLEMQTKDIVPKARFCSVGADDNRIVDPLGDIYDCYEVAGRKSRRIGAISDGKVEFFPLKKTHSRRNILNIPECIECPAALFCGGGCPTQARLRTGSIFKPYCLQNREFIAQTLKAYYLAMHREGRAERGADNA
jgi:uncharacterized protein